MDKFMKYFFVFCFAVFFFAACNKGSKNTTTVKGNEGKKTTPANVSGEKARRETVDLKTLTPETKRAYEHRAKDIRLFFGTMEDSHQIFQEVWPHLTGDHQYRPSNLFRFMKASLMQIYSDNGLPFLTSGSNNCEKGAPRLRTTLEEGAKTYSYQLELAYCTEKEGKQIQPRQQVKSDNRNSKSKQHNKNNKNNKINNGNDDDDQDNQVTQKPAPSVRDVMSYPLASFRKDEATGRWFIQFFMVNFVSLDLFGAHTGPVEDAECSILANENNRLTHLSCRNLIQNFGPNEFIQLSLFDFDIKREAQLKIQGHIHQPNHADSNKRKMKIEVEDRPISEKLHIWLTELPDPNKRATPPASAPPAATAETAAPVGIGTAAPANLSQEVQGQAPTHQQQNPQQQEHQIQQGQDGQYVPESDDSLQEKRENSPQRNKNDQPTEDDLRAQT